MSRAGNMTSSGFKRSIWKHPIIKYVLLQICFWSIINTFLSGYIFLFFKTLESGGISLPINFFQSLGLGICLAVFHGIVLGVADFRINQFFFVVKSVGRLVVQQNLLSIIVFVITFYGLRYVVTQTSFLTISNTAYLNDHMWKWAFYLLLLHYFAGSMVVSFANHVVKKYGNDVLMPMLLGIYRKPREEDRIFMFLDLKSSTSMAEQLGHLKYSELVQDFIIDVNRSLSVYNANIYQYVGDEIVLTWDTSATNSNLCIEFFYACERLIGKRSAFYMDNFGLVPSFKAGVDCGKVTAVEIGDVKRDIAYHGDILNTASRIQSLCNSVDRTLLISKSLQDTLPGNQMFRTESLGALTLKGKENSVEIFAVSKFF